MNADDAAVGEAILFMERRSTSVSGSEASSGLDRELRLEEESFLHRPCCDPECPDGPAIPCCRGDMNWTTGELFLCLWSVTRDFTGDWGPVRGDSAWPVAGFFLCPVIRKDLSWPVSGGWQGASEKVCTGTHTTML